MKKGFKDISEKWLGCVKVRRKNSTYRRYEYTFNKYILPVFIEYKITKITKRQITVFFNSLKDKGLRRNTILSILNVFKCIYSFSIDELGIKVRLSVFNEVSLPKVNRVIDTLLPNEVFLLIRYLSNNISLKALGVLIALSSGLRVGEVCALKWGDIDLDKKVIRVNKTVQRVKTDSGKTEVSTSEPKTFSSKREVAIPMFLYSILERERKAEENYLLSGTSKLIEPRKLQYYFNSICEKAVGRKIKFHGLRHSFATLLLIENVDVKVVSVMLGHASVNTTLNFYRAVTNRDYEVVRDVIDKSYYSELKDKELSEIKNIHDKVIDYRLIINC